MPGLDLTGQDRRPSLSGLGFPVSLNGQSGQDPFSRAVSPIGHKFSVDMGYLKQVDAGGMGMEGIREEEDPPPPLSQGAGQVVNVVDFAFNRGHPHPPPSGGQGQGDYSLPGSPKSMSVDAMGPFGGPDRRPSFRTLLAHGHGPGDESPTLFDGPPPDHDHDHDHEMSFFPDSGTDATRRMSFSFATTAAGTALPSVGAVGRLSMSKGSEGMGLGLGLEVGDQWR